MVQQQPLRLLATIAGILLAVSLGSLLMGTCSFALQRVDGLAGVTVGLFGAFGLWLFAAGCVYVANRQWLGRTREERSERFALCMAIAIPVFLAIVLLGVNVYLALGGRI